MLKRWQYGLGFLILFQAFVTFSVYAADSKDPIRIGISLGLTGRYAEITRLQKFAYQLWEEQVNQRGGILGRRVQFIFHDDKGDPQTAIQLYQKFTETEKVDLIIGPYSTPLNLAVAPLAEKHGYPMLVAGASSDELWKHGYQNLFGMYPPAGRYAIGFFALLAQFGVKDISIISVDDGFSLSMAAGAKHWAPNYGLRVVDYQILPKKDPDLETAAKAARAKGAQVLLMSGHYEESIIMREALKRINWTPTAYYAAVGPTLQKYYEKLGTDAYGAFSTTNWEPREDLRWPGSAEFLKAFHARYKEVPSYYAAMAYAACQVLEKAILKAGTIDRAAVRDKIANMDMTTIVGRYAVDRTGVPAKRLPLIIQWQKGKREIVWPEEMQTAKPIFNK